MLKVAAKEKSTGLEKTVTIDTGEVGASFDLGETRKRMSESFGEEPPAEEVVVDGADSGEDTELTRARDLKKRAKNLLALDLDSEDSEDLNRSTVGELNRD
ncbi:MAG: hypothetical protein ACJAQT_003411 [Akkermansiaceae bacterium]|jgi:hypothetical protein